jgi:hypothetical protein
MSGFVVDRFAAESSASFGSVFFCCRQSPLELVYRFFQINNLRAQACSSRR